MPIKFPKGFARRKSSGNPLEELEQSPAETPSTFRVLERPRGGAQSFDGGVKLSRFPSGWPSKSPPKQTRADSFEESPANSYRGSGGSNTNSASTGGYYDAGSSSTRLSSSSTIPSSIDGQYPDDSRGMRQQKSLSNKQLPPPPPPEPQSQSAFSLRAAGRKFSLGTKSSKTPNLPSLAHAESYAQPRLSEESEEPMLRGRAMTESSYASTATPPKLETELGLPDFGGFGDMFDGLGKRRSEAMEGRSGSVPPSAEHPFQDSPLTYSPAMPPKSYSASRLDQSAPYPRQTSPMADIDSSPYSVASRTSHDGLMSSPSPVAQRMPPSPSPWQEEFSPAPPRPNVRPVPSPTSTPGSTNAETFDSRPSRSGNAPATGLRRSSAVLARRVSVETPAAPEPVVDEDARLVMESVQASRFLSQEPASPTSRAVAERVRDIEQTHRSDDVPSPASPLNRSPQKMSASSLANDRVHQQRQDVVGGRGISPAGLFDSEDPELAGTSEIRGSSNNTTPRAAKSEPVPRGDASLVSSMAATNLSTAAPAQRKKVMTPAEFESYRRQHMFSRNSEEGSDSGSDEADAYDDEDETERNRQVAKQRRKQEAHMAVYRQQMLKVTGEQPNELPSPGQRPGFGQRASGSSPTIPRGLSSVQLNGDKQPETKSSDDEDDEVPLGILAAHGFPGKNRPPTSLSAGPQHGRTPSQMSTYAPSPGSVAGESPGAGRSSTLPAFAKHLPHDPYFGASLVNPSNRESLAYGHNSAGSAYGGSAGGLPAGGLVGVIADEERARALRRGTPNAAGNFGHMPNAWNPSMPGNFTGGGRAMSMGPMPGMPGVPGMPGMPNMMAGEQTQAQMSHMTQMMQTQMQWMQQMMQGMQGMQGMQMPPQPNQPPGPHDIQGQQNQGPRPASMGAQVPLNTSPSGLQSQGRTMSMMSPSASQWALNDPSRASRYAPSMALQDPSSGQQGYAPSIAPSERSNVGMPSRYRPVSSAAPNAPNPQASRASTFTAETLQGNWPDKQGSRRTTPSPSMMMSSANSRKSPRRAPAGDDEDEDEAWEEMRRRREKKKSTWRLKKEPNPLMSEDYFTGS